MFGYSKASECINIVKAAGLNPHDIILVRNVVSFLTDGGMDHTT